jgi:hypothetical protein
MVGYLSVNVVAQAPVEVNMSGSGPPKYRPVRDDDFFPDRMAAGVLIKGVRPIEHADMVYLSSPIGMLAVSLMVESTMWVQVLSIPWIRPISSCRRWFSSSDPATRSLIKN